MRLRRFSGRSAQEVTALVKAALGPDAVILDTEECDGVMTVTAAADADERPATPREDALAAEVRELTALVRHLVAGGARPGEKAPDLTRLHGLLLAQGMDASIAGALVRETATVLDATTSLDDALAATLARPAAPETRVRVFVGPPGDGKTTVVAKLAACARHDGRRVLLVGTDTHRVGAQAQLETYGRVLDVPVVLAAAPRHLRRALAEADADVVLVDTAGTAPASELVALLAAAGDAAVPTLVASGSTGAPAAARLWSAFGGLAPAACVMTKLDLAPAGALLGTLWHEGVAVSHLGTGPGIGDALEPASASRLARELLAA
jgi:flagellar biosynthesis protein FlhF